jgi:hypothetical protein
VEFPGSRCVTVRQTLLDTRAAARRRTQTGGYRIKIIARPRAGVEAVKEASS